jgi:hypothetical protein
MNIKKENDFCLEPGDLITYDDYKCIIVDDTDDGEREYAYLLMDVFTGKVVDGFKTLEELKDWPNVFLIAKANRITLTIK